MKRHPDNASADTLRDQRLHPGSRVILRAGNPYPTAVLHTALGRIRHIDFDEHVLLQFGEPPVGPRLLPASFVFDKSARTQDQWKPLGDSTVDGRLLHGEADIGHPELLG